MPRIVYDTVLKRPGCVLIQAAMQGSPDMANLFPVESWLTHITPDMAVYEATQEQIDILVSHARFGHYAQLP